MGQIDLQYLIDQEKIRRLRHDFAWFLDTAQPDRLADLFAPDGFIDAGPWGRMEGQEAIRRGYGRAYAGAPRFNAMHAVSNGRLDIDGDQASGTWTLLEVSLTAAAHENPLKLMAVYHETYRRLAEGWRMSGVTIEFLWSESTGRVTPENPMVRPRRNAPEDRPSQGSEAAHGKG